MISAGMEQHRAGRATHLAGGMSADNLDKTWFVHAP